MCTKHLWRNCLLSLTTAPSERKLKYLPFLQTPPQWAHGVRKCHLFFPWKISACQLTCYLFGTENSYELCTPKQKALAYDCFVLCKNHSPYFNSQWEFAFFHAVYLSHCHGFRGPTSQVYNISNMCIQIRGNSMYGHIHPKLNNLSTQRNIELRGLDVG